MTIAQEKPPQVLPRVVSIFRNKAMSLIKSRPKPVQSSLISRKWAKIVPAVSAAFGRYSLYFSIVSLWRTAVKFCRNFGGLFTIFLKVFVSDMFGCIGNSSYRNKWHFVDMADMCDARGFHIHSQRRKNPAGFFPVLPLQWTALW